MAIPPSLLPSPRLSSSLTVVISLLAASSTTFVVVEAKERSGKREKLSGNNKSKKSSSGGYFLSSPDNPVLCTAPSFDGPKIPGVVLADVNLGFRSNGGAVFTRDSTNDPLDPFDRTVLATDDWPAFDTPYYEFDPDANTNTGPGNSGYKGCDVCSPPEPYPLRTALPKIAMPRCPQSPYAIFVPATYEDAATAVNVIRDHNETFTVLSGGHDYECQSGLPDGVLILTSLLNKLEVNYEEGTLTSGAGNLWQTIYDRLDGDELDGTNAERYGVMGAQCGFVSVSGFSLGGGLCWHMSKLHGMGADTILSMKVVTADGALVDATLDNEYSDLRWGMAGTGGMSMGLAVEFTYEMKKSRPGDYLMARWEYRFYPEEPTDEGKYSIEDIPPIVLAWAEAMDKIEEDDVLRPKIGSIRARLNAESYGHRLQIRAMCSEGVDLRTYAGFQKVVSEYPALKNSAEIYTSINDYVKTRRNHYPETVDNPRVSSFIKGGGDAFAEALSIHLRFYLDIDDEDRPVAGSDVDFYLLKGFVKKPERISLNPSIADAKWHITNRAKHSYNPDLEMQIRCKNREITRRLKKRLGKEWAGPYWNYFDSSADKEDYYGDIFEDVVAIKEKYDPGNLFKKIKGIKVDDDQEIECLEEFCNEYDGYWDQWPKHPSRNKKNKDKKDKKRKKSTKSSHPGPV